MKKENTLLVAVQDIGGMFNGIPQYRVPYHAVLSEDFLGRKTALCGARPHMNGNGWGWECDISRLSCEKCDDKITYNRVRSD